MSLLARLTNFLNNRFPRPRGDEPQGVFRESKFPGVFPARAGMSRLARRLSACQHGFPRPRGDEPSLLDPF